MVQYQSFEIISNGEHVNEIVIKRYLFQAYGPSIVSQPFCSFKISLLQICVSFGNISEATTVSAD